MLCITTYRCNVFMYILYGLLIIILYIITQVFTFILTFTMKYLYVYHIRHSDNMSMFEYAIVFKNN